MKNNNTRKSATKTPRAAKAARPKPTTLMSTTAQPKPGGGGCVQDCPPSNEAIASRAYEIWQQEGCPEGREKEHWQQAQCDLATGVRAPTPAA